MSDSNPLLSSPQANMLQQGAGQSRPNQAPAQTQPGSIDHGAMRRAIISGMQGISQADAIRHRDVAGRELAMLQKIMTDENASHQEVADYIRELTKRGDLTPQEALAIFETVPKGDSEQIRQWASQMFGAVLHTSVHLHSAFPQDAFPGAAHAPARVEMPSEAAEELAAPEEAQPQEGAQEPQA